MMRDVLLYIKRMSYPIGIFFSSITAQIDLINRRREVHSGLLLALKAKLHASVHIAG